MSGIASNLAVNSFPTPSVCLIPVDLLPLQTFFLNLLNERAEVMLYDGIKIS